MYWSSFRKPTKQDQQMCGWIQADALLPAWSTSPLRDCSTVCHCNWDGHGTGHCSQCQTWWSMAGSQPLGICGRQQKARYSVIVFKRWEFSGLSDGHLQYHLNVVADSSPGNHERVNLRPDILPVITSLTSFNTSVEDNNILNIMMRQLFCEWNGLFLCITSLRAAWWESGS